MCSLLYTRVDGVYRLGRLEVLAVTGMGVSAAALGGERDVRAYIIFVTVILATGLMSSPASQNAMPSHMIIEIGMWGSSASLSGLKPVPVSVPASYIQTELVERGSR